MKSEIFFTTGEFASMCEVNKQTLFHYDKINLLKPAFKDNKGYRYYSHYQLDIMFLIESLKEMETPLKEIKDFIEHTNPDKMIEFFQNKSQQISKKITYLENLQTSIDKKVKLTKTTLETDIEQIFTQQTDDEYIYVSNALKDDDDYNRTIISDFYHTCMYVLNEKYSIGSIITKDSFNNGDFDNTEHLFARTKFMPNLPHIKKDAGVEVVAFHTGEYNNIEKTFRKVQDYLVDNNLEIKAEIYLEEVIDRLVVPDPDRYVTKITIPVLPKQ